MQKAFLVSNKTTQIREYLEHRSLLQVLEEHRSLSELDLANLGIVDTDKFIYVYYASDDADLNFRSDLNILRQLLNSAFFNVDEGIFIFVDSKNPMLEDLVRSACRNTNLVGGALTIIHHVGALTLNDVSKYIIGNAIGSEVVSSYKTVYIKEADSEEKERYSSSVQDGLTSILPVLTDQYTMYKKRAEVEAVSSGHVVSDKYVRPQIMQNFAKRAMPAMQQWYAFLITGEEYTMYEKGVSYILDYLIKIGMRMLVVDLTSSNRVVKELDSLQVCHIALSEMTVRKSFSEKVGYVTCRYNQLGYVIEMLDNIEGVTHHIFVCDKEDYQELESLLEPLCRILNTIYTTHFTEECVLNYLAKGAKSTCLFLSRAVAYEEFYLPKYKEDFNGTRVALLELDDADTTDYYECAVGGAYNG